MKANETTQRRVIEVQSNANIPEASREYLMELAYADLTDEEWAEAIQEEDDEER